MQPRGPALSLKIPKVMGEDAFHPPLPSDNAAVLVLAAEDGGRREKEPCGRHSLNINQSDAAGC